MTQGDCIEAEGNFVDHPVYGSQFKVTRCRAVTPEDAAGMERYLASGAIKGVGAALAARIVKKFGKDTFRIMEEEPERLIEVKGISERIAREISMQVEEKREMRDAFLYLQQYGISNALAVKIYNTYGERLYGVLQEIPIVWRRILKAWDSGSRMRSRKRSAFTRIPTTGSGAVSFMCFFRRCRRGICFSPKKA